MAQEKYPLQSFRVGELWENLFLFMEKHIKHGPGRRQASLIIPAPDRGNHPFSGELEWWRPR